MTSDQCVARQAAHENLQSVLVKALEVADANLWALEAMGRGKFSEARQTIKSALDRAYRETSNA